MLQLIDFMLIIVLLKKNKHQKLNIESLEIKKKNFYMYSTVLYVLQIFLTEVRRAQIHLRLV